MFNALRRKASKPSGPGTTMPSSGDDYSAIASIVANLAKYETGGENPFPTIPTTNGIKAAKILLPGEDSAAKKTLEKELQALAGRIEFLQRAAVNTDALPITPNEPGVATPFSPDESPRNGPLPTRHVSVGSRDQRTLWVTNWLSSKDTGTNDTITEEHLGYIRDHVNKQSDQIKSQRDHIDELSASVQQAQQKQESALHDGEHN
jgi:osomolarity two-component system, sensor histidine kinase NIK1